MRLGKRYGTQVGDSNSVVRFIFAKGNDIYAAGNLSGRAYCRKNGNAVPLTSVGTAQVINIGIQVLGNDVYMAEFEYAGGKKQLNIGRTAQRPPAFLSDNFPSIIFKK